MKKLQVLAGVFLLALMLVSIGVAAAEISQWPTLDVAKGGKKWTIYTRDVTDFSGRDVVKSSIVATWYGEDGIEHVVVPNAISQNDNVVVLHFSQKDLPAAAVGTFVRGLLENGEEFEASGPGFTYGVH